MKEYYSPLRYPGGKGKVAGYFKQVFKDNLLYDGVYVEPYAGGASVGLTLLLDQYASRIIINDIDKSIYAFWYSVLYDTDRLCKLVRDTPVNMDTWNHQQYVQTNKNRFGHLALGFSTFFLNRTNRSGILKAGVIGGKGQNGAWKIDARFNAFDLIERIERIAEVADRIELHNMDAVDLIKSLKPKLPEKSLYYFDPPYYVKGKDLYLNYYKHSDHADIANAIAQIKGSKWIVTYDSVPQIKGLYNNYRQIDYSLSYSAATASKGREVIVFSDNLYVPSSERIVLGKNCRQHAI